jgi:hypothetical protein
VPVLAIAAHIPSSEIGIDYFQATHPETLFKECSHFVELVSQPEQLPQILTRAIRVAVAQRASLSSSFRATSRSSRWTRGPQLDASPSRCSCLAADDLAKLARS